MKKGNTRTHALYEVRVLNDSDVTGDILVVTAYLMRIE